MVRAAFQCDPNAWYEATIGTPFADEFSETLDSGSIIVAHLSSDALKDCRPYDLVEVDIDGIIRKTMVVDTIVGTKRNMGPQGYWQYTIGLMSMTKLLEKVQLPNKSFTRNPDGEQMTIAEAVSVLVELYSPTMRLKTDTGWIYTRFFSVGTLPERMSTTRLKDVSMGSPTLRQALTAVMSQVGCIPVLDGRQVTCIDFKANHGSIVLEDRNYTSMTRSNASDSYVTGLVSMADEVLDTDNIVIREALGFRDPSTAIISQTQNMYLNTTLPIYNVTKLELNWGGPFSVGVRNDMIYDNPSEYFVIDDCAVVFASDFTRTELRFTIDSIAAGRNYTIWMRNIVIRYASIASDGKYTELYSTGIVDKMLYYVSETTPSPSYVEIYANDNVPSGTNAIAIEFDLSISSPDTSFVQEGAKVYIRYPTFYAGEIDNDRSTATGKDMYAVPLLNSNFFQVNRVQYSTIPRSAAFDITSVCVEATKRKLLDTDFIEMTQGQETIDQISKYYHGTVQYEIGGTQITGFSETYSEASGWWTVNKTHMEVIIEALQNSSCYSQDFLDYLIDYLGLPSFYAFGTDSGIELHVDKSNISNYALYCGFNISYQPMNKINVRYDKSDSFEIPIPIVQLDTKQSGIAAMDDLSAVETDKCDRLGRPVLTWSERVGSVMDILPLGAVVTDYEDAVIFKRSYAIENGYVNVTYNASEAYVVANYSTAIQTKYRAYQYVSYGTAIERKEAVKYYVLVTRTPLSGYSASNVGLTNLVMNGIGIADILFPSVSDFRVNSGLREDAPNTYYVNDVSVISYGSDIVFNMMDFDTASMGMWIENKTMLGGVPQSWYMMRENEENIRSGFGAIDYPYPTRDDIIDRIRKSPLISEDMADLQYFFVGKYMHKDVTEKLGFTAQFELYTDDEEFHFTSRLMEFNSSVPGVEYYQAYWTELSEDGYEEKPTGLAPVSLGHTTDTITFRSASKVVAFVDGKYYDLFGYSGSGTATFTLCVSEVKGRHVWSDDGNVLSPVGNKI